MNFFSKYFRNLRNTDLECLDSLDEATWALVMSSAFSVPKYYQHFHIDYPVLETFHLPRP